MSLVTSGLIGAVCALVAVTVLGVLGLLWWRRRRRARQPFRVSLAHSKYSPLYETHPGAAAYVGHRDMDESRRTSTARLTLQTTAIRSDRVAMSAGESTVSLPNNLYLPVSAPHACTVILGN